MTIYAMFGLFMLFGIVKKNGILQVDYTNVLRARAKEDPNEVPGLFSERRVRGRRAPAGSAG